MWEVYCQYPNRPVFVVHSVTKEFHKGDIMNVSTCNNNMGIQKKRIVPGVFCLQGGKGDVPTLDWNIGRFGLITFSSLVSEEPVNPLSHLLSSIKEKGGMDWNRNDLDKRFKDSKLEALLKADKLDVYSGKISILEMILMGGDIEDYDREGSSSSSSSRRHGDDSRYYSNPWRTQKMSYNKPVGRGDKDKLVMDSSGEWVDPKIGFNTFRLFPFMGLLDRQGRPRQLRPETKLRFLEGATDFEFSISRNQRIYHYEPRTTIPQIPFQAIVEQTLGDWERMKNDPEGSKKNRGSEGGCVHMNPLLPDEEDKYLEYITIASRKDSYSLTPPFSDNCQTGLRLPRASFTP
ncbi:uncharacterized protein LOC110047328 [Orbicella faveolata]|uniref:uncharacterized protein LOC110047328 n=1 Tax=Orbicella faveolata TaxID=48498 RepID=UPI0009E5FCBB|nr:uncharacterized protein LOC110047328 [Orbicella faveolata]